MPRGWADCSRRESTTGGPSPRTTDMGVSDHLRGEVVRWMEADPDPGTRAELAALLAAAETTESALAELSDRFSGRLEFGTAGLRGALAAGPNRMNRAVVIQAAAGLAGYLRAASGTGPVVIGYDARHQSDQFARDTAAVMAGAGFQALVLPRPMPTPVLAFAIGHLAASAGVMVTASHNPPRGQRVQGLPRRRQPDRASGRRRHLPAHRGRRLSHRGAARRDAGGSSATRSWTPTCPRWLPCRRLGRRAACSSSTPHCTESETGPSPRSSGEPVSSRRSSYAQQQEPDPDFPTVSFPNPEEPGAIDLAMELARQHGADIVVANDPDADRCAVAVPTPHGWRMLRGDEVGALLGDHLVRRGRRGVFATTIVSSSLLADLAARHGLEYAETLTGFKWIGRVPGLGYGYEEALGYCVAPDLVRDKDGVSALLLVCELAAGLRARGPYPARPAGRDRPGVRPARHRPAIRAGRGRLPDRGDHGPPPREPTTDVGWLSRWSRSTTSAGRPERCRRPTACATGWPRGGGSSYDRPAPSRS